MVSTLSNKGISVGSNGTLQYQQQRENYHDGALAILVHITS